MQSFPRGLKPLAASAISIGIALSVIQRWLMWRALADASPGQRRAVLYSWHLGMLRTAYYPATGQSLVPWIRTVSLVGALLLLLVAVVFARWALRSTTRVS